MKSIKSKLFNLLFITIVALSPTFFFQYSCSKNEKDDKLFKKEIYELKEKNKNLEKIKSTLSFQLKPFNNLMAKYKVDNYEDLMKHLTDLDDPILQKTALLLANCLLETKTMVVSELCMKLNDKEWKNKNKKILESLLEPLQLKSLDDFVPNFSIDNKVKVLAENISKIKGSNFIKDLENDIDKTKAKLVESRNELIPFYLWQLHNGNYQDWGSFAAKFSDESWKNQEKNRSIIGKLAAILECSFADVNQQKIEDLKRHENIVLQLVKNWEQVNDVKTKKIGELEQTNNELQQRIKNLEQQKKMAEQAKDLDLLLQTYNLKDYDDLKDKFKKLDAVYKRISSIHGFINDLMGIYKGLSDLGMISIKTTADQISIAIKNIELPAQKKMMTFLYNTMLRLGVVDIDKLFQKLNNWLELLAYIDGENLDSIGSLIKECYNFKKWTENSKKGVQDEIFDAIQQTSLLPLDS